MTSIFLASLAKLAAFYTVFYFCLGCFFVLLLYIFANVLDRDTPTYYNSESTMAVRTTASVGLLRCATVGLSMSSLFASLCLVGMGFRPQPHIDENLIRVSNDREQQTRMASSLRLYRDGKRLVHVARSFSPRSISSSFSHSTRRCENRRVHRERTSH